MDERKLLALGVLLGAASGKPPEQWLSQAHEFLREQQREDPMNATALTVVLAAAAFYAAERKDNPKISSFLDALVYSSTNISVGYSDILARTPMGKAIGSALMTYGPALASRAFDAPESAIGAQDETNADAERNEPQLLALNAITQRLDAILARLEGLANARQD